jgi:amidase
MNSSVSRRDVVKTVSATANSVGVAECADAAGAPALTRLSAQKLAQLIAGREVSAEEVARAHLERIAEVNPQINAIFQVDPERILAEARQADRDLKQGVCRGPLHGVPFTVKDQFETAGIVTTNGCPELADYVPTEDATVVKRLKDAGGILLGKTNVPEMCTLGITDNLVYGQTKNPYDLERTPGGSSGGEAAIIAAAGSPFGLGTDIGDSIRSPSHYCGIAGIKPTSRRVPETGMLGAFPFFMATWNAIGPMARHVEDLELVLRVISGPDGADDNTVQAPLLPVSEVPLDQLRVAYFIDDGVAMPGKETRESVERVAKELSAAGLTVVQDRPEGFDKTMDVFKWLAVYLLKHTTEYWWREYARMAGSEVVRPRYFVNEYAHRWFHYLDSHHDWSDANRFRLELELHRFRQRMMEFTRNYDVLLSPVLNEPAKLHTTPEEMAKLPVEKFWSEPMGNFCVAQNVTGWPAAVVRAGTSPDGLPIGVHIAAKPWREDVALAVAGVIEQRLGGWQPPPNR